MGERIGIRNFISRKGYHPATRWSDEALINELQAVVDSGGPTTRSYLQQHHAGLNSALSNHGRRRIFDLAGVYLPARSRRK